MCGEKRVARLPSHVAAHLKVIGQFAQDHGATAQVYRVTQRHL
jgi:hypothetical protein